MAVKIKNNVVCLILAASAAFAGSIVLADDGPILRNVNPQGLVTNPAVKITLDTEDLARCRYSFTDTSYDSMNNNFYTDDGLYHIAELGTLNKGSYTYYVRCKDFEGYSNNASIQVKFNVGSEVCIGDNCGTVNPPPVTPPPADTAAPLLSKLLPSGTTYNSSVVLSVTTNEPAECRYSWYDKAFESMTLFFTSTDRLYHSAPTSLINYGYYTYYVRCRDTAGNINQVAGRISFRYATTYVAPATPAAPAVPADKTPPVISGLAPSGEVNMAQITISCATDEAATCKYGKTDADYDSLADTLDTASGLSHSKAVTLTDPGQYTYYIRCKDQKGNKNTVSAQIGFNYVVPKKEGPAISNLQPTGAIYQSNVALIVTTDKPADCRYSDSDTDFDEMTNYFDTSDGSLHQATVNLEDYGTYAYYVRCRDKEGNKDGNSQVINFEYKNPNPPASGGDGGNVTPPQDQTPKVSCAQTQKGDKDGVCDPTADCVCDPDCPSSGDDADADCANVAAGGGGQTNNSWIAILIIGLLLLVIIAIVIIIIKRKGSEDEEEVELP
jgi:hypothetical protein